MTGQGEGRATQGPVSIWNLAFRHKNACAYREHSHSRFLMLVFGPIQGNRLPQRNFLVCSEFSILVPSTGPLAAPKAPLSLLKIARFPVLTNVWCHTGTVEASSRNSRHEQAPLWGKSFFGLDSG